MRKSGNLFLNFVLRAIICVWGGEAVAQEVVLTAITPRGSSERVRYVAYPTGYSSYYTKSYNTTCTGTNSYLHFSNASMTFNTNGTVSITTQTGNNSECYCQPGFYWNTSSSDCVSCGVNYIGGTGYHKNTSCVCPAGYENVYDYNTSKYSCNKCAAGYYQTTAVKPTIGSSCKKCPAASDGAQVSGGGTSMSGCYIAKDSNFVESGIGEGVYTSQCNYSSN